MITSMDFGGHNGRHHLDLDSIDTSHYQNHDIEQLKHEIKMHLLLKSYGRALPMTGRCCLCGERFEILCDDTTARAASVCPYQHGFPDVEVEINVPSGVLVFANDLRRLVELDSLDDDMSEHLAGQLRYTQAHAQAGHLHLFVGNSCPSVYQTKKTLRIGGKGGEAQGSICTDLWWVSAMDQAQFVKACAEHHTPQEALDAFDAFEVAVEPGRWAFSVRYGQNRDARNFVYSKARRVGPVVEQAVRSPFDNTQFLTSQAWAFFNHRSPITTWGDFLYKLHHSLHVGGNGCGWSGGYVCQQRRQAPAFTADQPLEISKEAHALLDFKPWVIKDWQLYPASALYPPTGGLVPMKINPYWAALVVMFYHHVQQRPYLFRAQTQHLRVQEAALLLRWRDQALAVITKQNMEQRVRQAMEEITNVLDGLGD